LREAEQHFVEEVAILFFFWEKKKKVRCAAILQQRTKFWGDKAQVLKSQLCRRFI